MPELPVGPTFETGAAPHFERPVGEQPQVPTIPTVLVPQMQSSTLVAVAVSVIPQY